MLRRDAIGRHLTSEMFFSGDRLPGCSETIEHPDGLVVVDTGLIDTTPAIEDDGEEWHPHPLPPAKVRQRPLSVKLDQASRVRVRTTNQQKIATVAAATRETDATGLNAKRESL